MQRQELINQLSENHQRFIHYIQSLTDDEFTFSNNGKWTAGQQLEHIILAVKPLAQGLQLPPFLIKLFFGKANRASKTYDELIAKYLEKLKNGGKASGRFIPKEITIEKKEKLIRSLKSNVNKLNKQLEKFSEYELDTLILPHPLLGKLTVREMMYFTIYHVVHHQEILISRS